MLAQTESQILMPPAAPVTRSAPRTVSPQEYQARVDLAACYRLMDHYGMTDLLANHITSRVPGTHDQFLLNAYGFHYAEVKASNLVVIDIDGDIIDNPTPEYFVSKPGYVIHSAIHAARPDVLCIIHTHTRAGTAVSAMDCGLLPISQQALKFYNRLGYHDYEGPAVDEAEREKLVEDLGPHNALVLRNHGLLTCGRTVSEAFHNMYLLETACKIQVDVLASGQKPVPIPEEVCERSARVYESAGGHVLGTYEWPTHLRTIDAKDSSFRN